MKKIQKFLRETKTGGMLGCKRRFQMRTMCLGLLILCLCLTACFAGAVETGNFAPVAMMAVAPAAVAVDFTQFAKKNEDLSPEEQSTLGTIQKCVSETINQALQGTITEEQMMDRLKTLSEEIDKKSKESSDALEVKLKEANDIITTMRNDLNGLQEDMRKSREAFEKSDKTSESIRKSLESDNYEAFSNGRQKSTGLIGIALDKLRSKGVVSMTGNYSGNVFTAGRSDVFNSEVALVRPHLRDYMRVIDANDEEITTVYYRQMYDINRAALAVSENGTLPEGSFKVKEKGAETHRVGWYCFISKRMLRKVTYIMNRIMELLPSGLYQQEDFQILWGDKKDANFEGIVKVALTESALSGTVYTEQTAGKVKSIASYDNGASVLVTLNGEYAKMKTGMKVVFSGFQTCTALNAAAGFEIKVLNDHALVVPCTYTAETDSSVQTNALFTISKTAGIVENANIGDAISAVVSYLEFDVYRPNMIVINPMTLNTFIGMKDGIGRPLWREYFEVRGGVYYFRGLIPVVPIDAMTKGKILVGDFMNGVELYDTQRGFIEFAEDVDTKLANEVVAIIQEEVIMPVLCPESFMYADIANVISAINVEAAPAKVAITSPLNDDQDALLMEAKQ